MFELRNVSKHYQLSKQQQASQGHIGSNKRALDQLDLGLSQGKALMVLGTKHAGKTTLLQLLAASRLPDAGQLFVLGLDVQKSAAAIRQQIGFLSPQLGFYNYLTVKEQLSYVAQLKGMGKQEASVQIAHCLEDWELDGNLAKRSIARLSAEQLLRLSIAQAMVNKPKLLLLDEPALGLDVFTAKPIIRLVEKAKKESISLVYATNNLSKVELLGDELLVLHQGRKIYQASMEYFKNNRQSENLASEFLRIVETSM